VRRRRRIGGEAGAENFWPSFTDLISTIALILFVLVLLAYLQNLISSKNLARVRAELDLAAQRLASSQQAINTSQQKLRLLEADLRKTTAEIEAAGLRNQAAMDEINRQQTIIDTSHQELSTLRARLQGIAVLRVDVLNKVKQSIETELARPDAKRSPPVLISDNGNIIINENLVFEYDSHAIRPEGKPLLETLAKALAKVLADGKVSENIDVVLIQGHTDERGSSTYNRDLSAKRANSVLNFMFETNPVLEHSFGSFFAASAYSEFRPINLDKTEAGFQQNRRIEISVVLKDSTIRNTIDEYMKNIAPPSASPAPTP
jgi:chemotaxis protein MotB